MVKMKLSEILKHLETKAPSSAAEPWDNVGLLLGSTRWLTRGAVISVDLTEKSIQVARARGYRLIVTHHPAIFPSKKGINRLIGGPLLEAARAGIGVVACHSNFDRCALEVVDQVSAGLKVKPYGRLHEEGQGALSKIVVFVPVTHLDQVRDGMTRAGAGHIGNYDSCTFAAPGEGTFRPREGARPFLGSRGRLEKVQEVRLETVFPEGLQSEVLSALRATHPYEEIAYDLYTVQQELPKLGVARGLGYGFWGEYPRARSFSEVVRDVRSLFRVKGFWLTEPAPRRVKRVAFAAGKGSSWIGSAASVGCDLLITGEAGYHDALSGTKRGVAVMELGHRESERFFAPTIQRWLTEIGLKVADASGPTQKLWLGGNR